MARQANDGLLLQLAAQIERALGGQWNSGATPGVHVTQRLSGALRVFCSPRNMV